MDQFLDYIMSEKSHGYIAPKFKAGEIKTNTIRKERLDCMQMAGLIRLNYISASELDEVSRQLSLALNHIRE